MLISAEHLSINFGSRQLLDDVDFYLNEGDKTGVIGINGTGKSTFLKVLAGKLQPDGGTIARKPNLQVSVLAQNPDMRDELTVLEQVFASMPPEFRQLNEYEAKTMLNRLGLSDFTQKVGTLSGGNQQKIVVARELDRGCRMLIAAQPTRGVDIASADYIQGRILAAAEQGCAVLLISSDLDELIKVSDRIMVLFRGQIMGFVDADNATREALGRMMLGEAH